MTLPRRALILDDDDNDFNSDELLPPLDEPTANTNDSFYREEKSSSSVAEKEAEPTSTENESGWIWDPKAFLLTLGLLSVVLGGMVYAIYHFGMTDRIVENMPQQPTNQSSTVNEPSKDPTTSTGNPILDQYPDAPKVGDSSKITVTIPKDKKSIVTDSGSKLTIDKSFFISNNRPCTVTKNTDFCLVGSTTEGDVMYNIYFFKDAAHSMLFEDVSNFTKATVKGSPSAGVLPVDTNNQKNAALAVVNKDSSGWVILSNTGDFKKVEKLASKVTVTSK